MLLVSGGTTTIRPLIVERPDIFGTLSVPADRNALPEFGRWAADNGAFSKFDEPAFLAMLNRCRWARERCLFVVAPDVVADHAATFALFQTWGPRLMEMGWPVAFVAQDGCDGESVPWEGLAAVFIGGSTAYKLSAAAAHVVVMAHALGKWVHMGRVNTARRLHYAAVIGCDSVDGSGWSKWPKSMLERHGDLLRTLSAQRRLALGAFESETA
jgi:hypothetical protein